MIRVLDVFVSVSDMYRSKPTVSCYSPCWRHSSSTTTNSPQSTASADWASAPSSFSSHAIKLRSLTGLRSTKRRLGPSGLHKALSLTDSLNRRTRTTGDYAWFRLLGTVLVVTHVANVEGPRQIQYIHVTQCMQKLIAAQLAQETILD